MPDRPETSTHNPTPPPVPPAHPTPGVSGKLILLGSLVGCIALFFLVWGILRSVERHVRESQPRLVWAERATWHAPAVIRDTLVKPNAANAQYTYNKPRYRDPGLIVAPEEEQTMLACAELARLDLQAFADEATRQAVIQHPDAERNFYVQYLLGTWHALNNQPDEADDHYQRALDLAPRILVVRFTDPAGQPVAGLRLERVEIGCDRVTDGGTRLDQRLVLAYPHLQTDAAGRVYLPVYHTTYRPVYLPEPDGYNTAYTPGEGWFNTASRLGLIEAKVKLMSGDR